MKTKHDINKALSIPKNEQRSDLIYKNTKTRSLKLTFIPPAVKKYEKSPIYFLIPGGGWHVEDRQSMLDFSKDSVEALRNEGFAVVSIDYRICSEGAAMRDIIADCFDALAYIAHFAQILGIDKDRIVLSGHSAGAHLALMLAYAPRTEFDDRYEFDETFTIKAVAAMSAPTILYDIKTHALWDIGDVFPECNTMEEKARTSPISYVSPSCPPTLLCAGTSDYVVYGISSERIYFKLKEHNVKTQLILSVCGGHSFEKMYNDIKPSVSLEQIQKNITEFILKEMAMI